MNAALGLVIDWQHAFLRGEDMRGGLSWGKLNFICVISIGFLLNIF